MSKRFYEDLDKLKANIREMGMLAESMLRKALNILVQRDASLMSEILQDEEKMDQFQRDLDNETVRLISVYTPVAGDLRVLLMATRINAELERIGDNVVSICRNYRRLLQEEPLKPLVDLPRMVDIAIRMLHGSLNAFSTDSVDEALIVIRDDDELDRLNDQVFRELITYMLDDPRSITRALGLILVSRSIERIGDRAVNIAEDVVYIVQGRDIRHEPKTKNAPEAPGKSEAPEAPTTPA